MEKGMNKFNEIEVLQSLKGDTYFAQFFGEDIDRMCANIKSDYPIEMGCKFNEKAEALRGEIKNREEKARVEKKVTVEKILEYGEPDEDSELYHYCESLCGRLFIIETKMRLGQEVTADEVYFLIKQAKGNQ